MTRFFFILFATSAHQAAPPQVPDSEAQPGETGYRPADGAAAQFNPPH